MKKSCNLNEALFRTASMGRDSLSRLMPFVEDASLIAELAEMRQEYNCVERDSARRLVRSGKRPKPISRAARAAADASMRAHLAMRRDRSAIAKMVIQGNVMAIIEVTRAINNCRAEKDAAEAAKEFVCGQQQAIDRMTAYL